MALNILTNMTKKVILILVIYMTIKELRTKLGVTIKKAAEVSGVPLRTYIRYEKDEEYGNSLKRKQILFSIQKHYEITEEKGLLSIEQIKKCVNEVIVKYGDSVSFCYLFGSYAKGYAKEESDVDLCVSTSLMGLSFVGLIEDLRIELRKKVDVLRLSDMGENLELISEIMKEGIKIYG